jgi:Big-like domain-containing protein
MRIEQAAVGLVLLVSLALAAACAIVEAPQGGPVDTRPPRLISVEPDSGTVNLTDQKKLRFRFSEKMDRKAAASWLRIFPEQEIKSTKWHGATEAEVVFFDPLPADTVVVVELMPGTTDSHRVRSDQSRRYPLATGDSLYSGLINGRLVMGDTAMAGAVVELFSIPPDTVEYFQQKPLRRTESDALGIFRFDWLPVPGGPWLLRAYADKDHNLRAGEKDAQRLLPDTLSISATAQVGDAGTTTIFAWDHPGTLQTRAFPPPEWAGGIGAWALSVTDADTGWAPAPMARAKAAVGWLDPATGGSIPDAPPHVVRVIVFVDIDGDSTFSAVPDSLYGFPGHAEADTTPWFLEPWGLVEGIELEPGLFAEFVVPAVGDSLVPWAAPIPVALDSLATTPGDSLSAAVVDSTLLDFAPVEQE